MKVAGHYGEEFHPGKGIGQGDPLSMRFFFMELDGCGLR